MRLSLIIPTIWRSTLNDAIASAQESMRPDDEIIVVGDSETASWEAPGPNLVVLTCLGYYAGDYGCTACDRGIQMATGDYVFFCGDDDTLTPEAFEIIRRGVAEGPDLPHLFAMNHQGRVLKGSFRCGEVSGQQIVVPRDMSKMPKMADHSVDEGHISDWRFIQNVRSAWGNVVVHEEIIAILTQQNRGRML